MNKKERKKTIVTLDPLTHITSNKIHNQTIVTLDPLIHN